MLFIEPSDDKSNYILAGANFIEPFPKTKNPQLSALSGLTYMGIPFSSHGSLQLIGKERLAVSKESTIVSAFIILNRSISNTGKKLKDLNRLFMLIYFIFIKNIISAG